MRTVLGASYSSSGTSFSVWSSTAERIWLCLFNAKGRETDRIEMARGDDGVFAASVAGIADGQRYGFRADGAYDPKRGLWFDPDKLLVDPYAVEIDRPYVYDARLAARRGEGSDTADLLPKSIVKALPQTFQTTPVFRPGGLIYELNVRAFTMLHTDVPKKLRGTVAALAHPAVIEHLTKLGVSAVELMPITAWIDERHLPPLGLTNAWGYNPVSFMALDPRQCPGGVAELRATVEALRTHGIGVILDLVFNHSGESDALGPTLSLRGLDANAYYRRAPGGKLVNDTGTGNTIACDHPRVRELIVASLRHFVANAGVDGFRFDLAPILGRTATGFDARAETLKAIETDPILADRVMIAEPWDIGPDGYRLGQFSPRWLEWNDRYRDDIKRFWRGDAGTMGSLAMRLAGSSDVFGGAATTRSVNFIAAHDGFALADIVAYERKHNEANGEKNRDGHNDNLSWNNGVEGETGDAKIVAARQRDLKALLATLFMSRGTIMLTAGDEFGRSQQGNNNAYCQDNAISWIDWKGRDRALEAFAGLLSKTRKDASLEALEFFAAGDASSDATAVEWLGFDWQPMTDARWNEPANHRLVMVVGHEQRCAILFNGDRRAVAVELKARDGCRWTVAAPKQKLDSGALKLDGRSVVILREEPI